MTPEELSVSAWIPFLNLSLVAVPGLLATCSAGSGRIIDYFVTTPDITNYITAEAIMEVPWKPHVGIKLTMPTRLRQFSAPKLRVPKSLPELDLGTSRQDNQVCRDRACQYADKFHRPKHPRHWYCGMQSGYAASSGSMSEVFVQSSF